MWNWTVTIRTHVVDFGDGQVLRDRPGLSLVVGLELDHQPEVLLAVDLEDAGHQDVDVHAAHVADVVVVAGQGVDGQDHRGGSGPAGGRGHEAAEQLAPEAKVLADPAGDDLAGLTGQLCVDLVPSQLFPVSPRQPLPRSADFTSLIL